MPNINEMLSKLEVSHYATPFNLSMVYDHIQLTEDGSNSCTIIIPWAKYHYKRLPTGVSNSPDIFQQKMSNLFQVIYLVISMCTYTNF